MSRKIIGVTVGTTLPKPNFKQTDPSKGDYIRNKPDFDGLKNKVNTIRELVGDTPVEDQINSALSNQVGKATESGGEVFNDYENNQAGLNAVAIGSETKAVGEASLAGGMKKDASGDYPTDENGNEIIPDDAWRYNEAIGSASMAFGMGAVAYSRASKSLGYRTQTGYPPSKEYVDARPEAVTINVAGENVVSSLDVILINNGGNIYTESDNSRIVSDSCETYNHEGEQNGYSYGVVEYSFTEPTNIIGLSFIGGLEGQNGTNASTSVSIKLSAISEGNLYDLDSFNKTLEDFNGLVYDNIFNLEYVAEKLHIKIYSSNNIITLNDIVVRIANDYPEDNVGQAAVAIGSDTVAVGNNSLAGGYQSKALEANAIALGSSTTASGTNGAMAVGRKTIASGQSSFATGTFTEASSKNQVTIGKYNTVDTEDKYAFIVGNGTGTSESKRSNALTVDWDGNATFAGKVIIEGDKYAVTSSELAEVIDNLDITTNKVNSLAGTNNTLTNKKSFVGGNDSTAGHTSSGGAGYTAIALGDEAIATGKYATAIGSVVNATGTGSVAIGYHSNSTTNHSIALGYNLETKSGSVATDGQLVVGKYNAYEDGEIDDALFVIGNGTSKGRKNALVVDKSGNMDVKGVITAEGGKELATQEYVGAKMVEFVDSAPETLNTLNELATALGNDPNFATTVATKIGEIDAKVGETTVEEQIADAVDGLATQEHLNNTVSQKSSVRVVESGKEEFLQTLKIHRLTQAEYDQLVENGTVEENALYLTPDEEVDLSSYATEEYVDSAIAAIPIPDVSGQIVDAIAGIVYPVSSVNGKTGAVVLTASDVGALPSDTVIPSVAGLATEGYVNSAVAQKSQVQIITWEDDD